jgi:hypothetical protein
MYRQARMRVRVPLQDGFSLLVAFGEIVVVVVKFSRNSHKIKAVG